MKAKSYSRVLNKAPAGQNNSSTRANSQTKQKTYIRKSDQSEQDARDKVDLERVENIFGFEKITDNSPRLGWLLNYLPVTLPDDEISGAERSALDMYFIDKNGQNFKATVFSRPYFYIDLNDPKRNMELMNHVQKRFDGCSAEEVDREDLDMPNHLSGKKHKYLKLSFKSVNQMNDARMAIRPFVTENKKSKGSDSDDLFTSADETSKSKSSAVKAIDPLVYIIDMREHDVTFPMRVAIDTDIRVGAWYLVSTISGTADCSVKRQLDLLERCEPRILAYDIECEKAPLKFPNAENDRIYMISYMISGQGYLIINREIVSADISDFEYTPLPKYPGPFIVFNEANEENMLRKFVSHIQELRPHVIVTYNGDFFDWPYVDKRCDLLGISLKKELGISVIGTGDGEKEYTGKCLVHLDAFAWVQRDSYLPQGTQGLKSVTKHKLGYDPKEVDPEDMTRLAMEQPEIMASYSVSDAVATYYLYTIYVHNFIFSMSTIIPLNAEDVLRKGSGTLCEALLMVEAYKGNIICPNKQIDPLESFHEGHLLESETYIGGHVECLEAGVFRADIPSKFSLVPSALQGLIKHIDRDLSFALETEHGIERTDVVNYDEVKQAIVEKLEMLRDSPNRLETPLIYHLDVGAMYPNIILTNRLQPGSLVSLSDCAACEFNRKENNCKRNMKWMWRGEYSPAGMNEYQSIKNQLTYEKINGKLFTDLSEKEQAEIAKTRLKNYSQKVYKKGKVTLSAEREDTVCMRENPFYVNTVRDFRDRRYDYKLQTKTWKGRKMDAEKKGDSVARKAAEDKEVLMDSLQLAHKCILNSFYGYVMRKGARWRSMEMAGIVTYTGAQLITQARELVEQIGRPLELDTDGIWCVLPASFPQDFKFKYARAVTDSSGIVSNRMEVLKISYPCAMLNADVHARYTNHQYQNLVDNQSGSTKKFDSHSECSIYFELDGPYKAMILPASPEEGKLLKKKYVVFNFDDSIAELKGFELKRRGELEIVKLFQEDVFDKFLSGDSLISCYEAVGAVANYWLDILDSRGEQVDDDELMHYISEKKTISKTLEDYEGRKATSLTTASRISDFLGAEMVKDKGLNCNLIISRLPANAPVTDRAIPVAIFSAEPAIRNYYLRKWLKDPYLDSTDFRDVVDWSYYKERLHRTIQKIITVPAGMQLVQNPCPRVLHPPWLQRSFDERASGKRQTTITALFGPKLLSAPTSSVSHFAGNKQDVISESSTLKRPMSAEKAIGDLEDMVSPLRADSAGRPVVHIRRTPPPAISTTPRIEVPSISPAALVPMLPPLRVADLIPVGSEVQDLATWLQHRKSLWKKKRADKKSERLASRHGSLYPAPQTEDSSEPGARKKPMGVADLVQNASLQAVHGTWQIVELQETDVPGEFVAWVMTSKTQLQRLTLVVPRTFYVNYKQGSSEEGIILLDGHKVKKYLPHERPCHGLYEISLSEKKFAKNEKALSGVFSDPSVEGVYETQVPLWFRAVIRIGCVARVSRGIIVKATKAFELTDLELLHTHAHPYLDSSSAVFRKIYLYHTVDRSRASGLGIVALFFMDGTSEDDERRASGDGLMYHCSRAFVWLANGFGSQDKPPLHRYYRQFERDERAQVKFLTTMTSTVAEALQLCNERLSMFLRERRGPTFVMAQGSYGVEHRSWRKALPLLQEFPLLIIPLNSTDDQYPAPIYWQKFVSERMIQRYKQFPEWLNDRLVSARFSHIPVANLGVDAIITMTDVLFARKLEANRHVLWASEHQLPDLGGSEQENFCVWSDPLKEPTLNVPGAYRAISIELELFGLTVCAIMSSGMLDSIGASLLSEGSGGKNDLFTDVTEDSSSRGLFSESSSADASCARAFNMVKAVVAEWIHVVESQGRGSIHADVSLVNLYRYLCGFGGESLMKDPALHRIIYGLMTKLFKRLIGEFKLLGVEVVFASFEKIIIHTKKHTADAANEYLEFIIATVKAKDIFKYLHISTKRVWTQLLWLERENWGGIPLKEIQVETELHMTQADDEDIEMDGNARFSESVETVEVEKTDEIATMDTDIVESDRGEKLKEKYTYRQRKLLEKDKMAFLDDDFNEEDDIEEENRIHRDGSETDDVMGMLENDDDDRDDEGEGGEDDIQGEWNLATYLPAAAAQYFHFLVNEFMIQSHNKWQELSALREEDEADTEASTGLRECDDETLSYRVVDFMKGLVSGKITKKLLEVLDELVKIYGLGRDSEQHFPVRAGSYLQLKNPALEFAKAVTHIMALDGDLEAEISALRRNLLTKLEIREFNSISDFRDPSLSYVLRDVICPFCSHCRDIDLLRDCGVAIDSSSEVATGRRTWELACPNCGTRVDDEAIEGRLVGEVHKASAAFLLQDMRCPQTHQVSIRFCSATSELSQPLQMDVAPDAFRQQLFILFRVAQFHNFNILESTIEEMEAI